MTTMNKAVCVEGKGGQVSIGWTPLRTHTPYGYLPDGTIKGQSDIIVFFQIERQESLLGLGERFPI